MMIWLPSYSLQQHRHVLYWSALVISLVREFAAVVGAVTHPRLRMVMTDIGQPLQSYDPAESSLQLWWYDASLTVAIDRYNTDVTVVIARDIEHPSRRESVRSRTIEHVAEHHMMTLVEICDD